MGEHYRERLSGEALEMLAERFKVFSEPMRLKLVYSLMDGEKTSLRRMGSEKTLNRSASISRASPDKRSL